MIAPSQEGVALLCINAVFSTLAVVSYILRFLNNLSRARNRSLPWHNFIAVDSLVFGATILVLLNSVFRIVSILLGGVGWDVDQLSETELGWASKALFIEELSWTTSLCLLKFAIIILYGRIFVSNTGRRYARFIQLAAYAAVAGLLIGSITYYLTQCKPLRAAWTPGLGHCAKPRAGWLGTGIANLVTDVFIFSVPVVWVADLQMSLHNKLTVSIQLFVGAIVSIISFIRIFMVVNSDPNNLTGSVVRPDIFSCIELNMAIVFASMSGIVGREAISNFVHRFVVARSTNYGEVSRPSDIKRRSGTGLRVIRMADGRTWQNLDIKVKTIVETNVEEPARHDAPQSPAEGWI